MRIIPTYVHGILDYVCGLFLFLMPEIMGFTQTGGPAAVLPRVVGVIILIQAVLTDYEVGLMRKIAMPTHLLNDYIVGAFLMVSPWLFRLHYMDRTIWLPEVVVGIIALLTALMTELFPRHAGSGLHPA